MILQALYKLAMDEHLMADPDYEMKPVAYLVRVDRDGRLLGIESTKETPPEAAEAKRKTKPKPQAKVFSVPRESGRTSGDRAFFLFDKAEYVFGMDPEGKRDSAKLRQRADLFLQRVRQCAEETGDEAVVAVRTFLDDLAAGRQQVALDSEVAGNDLFAFVCTADLDCLVTDRPAVRCYWKSLRRDADSQGDVSTQCLVSGEWSVLVEKHPVLKFVPGGTTSGVSLVSFNAGAFESYGWKGNQNAPVSREAAEAVSTALNRLLHPNPPDPNHVGRTLSRRNLRLSDDTVVCYWAEGATGQELCDAFPALTEVNPDEVKAVYQSIWKGRPYRLPENTPFYAMTLSGAQGRAVLRDWFESSVQEVVDHLAAHFADLDIVRNAAPPKGQPPSPAIPMRFLLECLAPLGKREGIPSPLAAELLSAALGGRPYPYSILQRAVERARAEAGQDDWAAAQRRDARAALIKAVLNRRKRRHSQATDYKEVTRDMDPTNRNPGYLLGRLLAVIERMQQEALGDVNATVIDRYFSGASATPAVVFPRLMKNLRHHARKARDSEKSRRTVGWLEGVVDDVVADMKDFPLALPLDQQGLFILGYHHERHWLWMKKDDREKLEADRLAVQP
ncbi:MAG: type I-C CRISPR-associated protein Cas8c/Csd1 [Phycisphaerae bacterium]|nr:type I-C CRISPR-associated protein Cas8c/Csd1 [Phycisphaerae bacterium]